MKKRFRESTYSPNLISNWKGHKLKRMKRKRKKKKKEIEWKIKPKKRKKWKVKSKASLISVRDYLREYLCMCVLMCMWNLAFAVSIKQSVEVFAFLGDRWKTALRIPGPATAMGWRHPYPHAARGWFQVSLSIHLPAAIREEPLRKFSTLLGSLISGKK